MSDVHEVAHTLKNLSPVMKGLSALIFLFGSDKVCVIHKGALTGIVCAMSSVAKDSKLFYHNRGLN